MRTATKTRATKETEITVKINLDGDGKYNVACDFKFFQAHVRTNCRSREL